MELLNINILDEEYSESSYCIDYLDNSTKDKETMKGSITIERDGFPLYIVTYEYTYNYETCSDNTNIEIKETFPECLEMYGLPDIH